MDDAFFSIPGDTMREAEALAEFKLVVPPDARVSKRDPEVFFWPESGTISKAQSGSYLSGEGIPVLTLECEATISPENGSGLNVGRDVGTTFRISNKALQAKAPKNLLTMSHMSLAKLKGLFAAIGVDPDLDNGGFSGALLREYFPPAESQFPTDSSPLLNRQISFQVKQAPFEDKEGMKRIRAEIQRFLPAGDENG
jgi:hypothetical protein